MRKDYVAHLQNLLPGESKVLLEVIQYDPQEMGGPPFSVPADEVESLFGSWLKVTELETREQNPIEPKLAERGLTKLNESSFLLTNT